MQPSLMRAFLIPIIALTSLILFWLAFTKPFTANANVRTNSRCSKSKRAGPDAAVNHSHLHVATAIALQVASTLTRAQPDD